MSIFKGNEKTEVRRWIVELEQLLTEMHRDPHTSRRVIAEREDALAWLRRLLAADKGNYAPGQGRPTIQVPAVRKAVPSR